MSKTFTKEVQVNTPIPSAQIVVCLAKGVILLFKYQVLTIRWVKTHFVSSFG